MVGRLLRIAGPVAAALALSACAAHRTAARSSGPGGSLENYIGKIRSLSALAKPHPSGNLSTSVETWDPRLAAALRDLDREPTAAHHRRVAEEYRRLQILDMAYDHLSAAARIDPKDAAAYEGRARIWRDWGVA